MGLPRLVTLLCYKRFKFTVHIEQSQYNTIVKKCKQKCKHNYNQLLGLPCLVTLLCYKRFKHTVVFTVQTQYKCNHKQKCKHKPTVGPSASGHLTLQQSLCDVIYSQYQQFKHKYILCIVFG